MLRRVLKGDSHCPIDLSAQLAAIVLERLRKRWNFGWPAADFAEQGSDEAVARRPGREHHMPRLDVGRRRRTLGQGEGLIHQRSRHRLWQEHPRRMTLSDRF